jgi:hypothetical protein
VLFIPDEQLTGSREADMPCRPSSAGRLFRGQFGGKWLVGARVSQRMLLRVSILAGEGLCGRTGTASKSLANAAVRRTLRYRVAGPGRRTALLQSVMGHRYVCDAALPGCSAVAGNCPGFLAPGPGATKYRYGKRSDRQGSAGPVVR